MTTPPNLAVVICHGSYHTPELYQDLMDSLKSRGIDAYCPQLPTSNLSKLNVGDVSNPDFDIGPPPEGYPQGEQDVEAIHSVLRPLIEEQGKRVIVLGHSSGGWSATQCAIPELQLKKRKRNGLEGGVIGLFFMSAFLIPVGLSVDSFFKLATGGEFVLPPFMTVYKHGPNGLVTPNNPEDFFFHDIDPGDAKKWSAKLTAAPNLTTVLTNDAYAAMPCAYLVLDDDRVLPKAYQEGMIAAQSAKTGEFKVYHAPVGHCPYFSWKDGIANTVASFAKDIEN